MSTSEATPLSPMSGPDRQEIDKQELMEAMWTKDSNESLRKAFDVLSKSSKTKDQVSIDVIQRSMPIIGMKVDDMKIGEILEKVGLENDKISRENFFEIMKNIWKNVADSMINDVEKVVEKFISNKVELENIVREFVDSLRDICKRVADPMILEVENKIKEFISNKAEKENDGNTRSEFINSLKDIWKRAADSKIQGKEKEIEKFISEKAGQEDDGNIRREFINSQKDIWKRATDSMIHQVEQGIDESIPNMAEQETEENTCREFINSLKGLWKKVSHLKINEVEEGIDEFIWNKAVLKNDGIISSEFTSNLKEEFGAEEVQMDHAMLLAKRMGSNVSAILLWHLLPFLGGNLGDTVIIDEIRNVKKNVDNDQQMNLDEIKKIMRNIWTKPVNFLSEAMGRKPSAKAATDAFKILCNPLDKGVSATILRVVMLNLSKKPDFEELYRTIYHAKANSTDALINAEEFTDIIGYVKHLIEDHPLDKIYGVLTREKTRQVVLSGESGVGKTWMATRIADRAKKEGKIDFALWVNLKGLNLRKIIAHQLSLLSAADNMETEKFEMSGEDKKGSKSLDERIRETLQKMKKKKFLLIFDGVNSSEELDEDLSKGSQLHELLNLTELQKKVLITTSVFEKLRQENERETIRIQVRPWSIDESETFVKYLIGDDKFSQVEDLAKFYLQGCKGLPAEILIIAVTLRYFVNKGSKKLEGVKEVVLKDPAHDYDDYRNIKKLFISTEVVPKVVLVDCYSTETPAEHFLNSRGAVHYNELISYWILEEHLGHFSCIEDAYAEGHRVLMELLDCGLLKPLKAGYVKSTGAKFQFTAQEYFDFYRNNRLGLATTFDNKLGNTALGDGMIRTFPSDKEKKKKGKGEEEEEKMSTLLLDGNRAGEVSDNLFYSMKDLENLAIFDPTHKSFPLSIPKNLRFLVLRGCEFFDNYNSEDPKPPKAHGLQKSMLPLLRIEYSDLKPIPLAPKLIVLEISGPSSLKTIPEYVFKKMTSLKSLNMTSLQMESLPASFYNLTTIEILILKDCSSLKRVESLKSFSQLQLLDLSGATSLVAFKDKSFKSNGELRMINLSQTRIAKFPVVRYLGKLEYLSLRKCPDLIRVRKIGSVKTLRVFDISGSKKVEVLLDPGLQKLKNLFVLNVSGTAVKRLPSNIGTPCYLRLSDCSNLKQLPPIETLSEVRVLDFSGSALLDDVKPKFIESLKNLSEFNLSKTGVVDLPSLSSLVNLRRLLMSQCQKLKKLEGLGSLINLEVLDLSGCKALSEIEDQSFNKMDRLESLDLSLTPLEKLPSLSNLKKLKKLNLRGCTKLTKIPGLEVLHVLEDLNVSSTTLKVPDNLQYPPCHLHGPKPSSFKIFDPIKILKDLGAQPHQQASGETKIDCDDKTIISQEKMDQCDHWRIWNVLASHNSKTLEEVIDAEVIDTHVLQLLETYPELLKDSIEKFHFLVYPLEDVAHQLIDDKGLLGNEIVLRKFLLDNVFPESQERVFPESQERCLEIRGFRDFPKFLEQLLKHAEMIVLVENSCIKFLSDLGAVNLERTKVCWIERCNEMEYVTDEVQESADILTENIKILCISEAANLRSICKKTSRAIGFSNLTSLYLDHCPELSSLCFSYKQFSGLKILHVKHCQKLVKLFDDNPAQLPNLESLHLWALPKLKEVSCGMQSLRTLSVAHCPLLEYIFDRDTSLLTNLPNLKHKVKFCDNMKSLVQAGELLPA